MAGTLSLTPTVGVFPCPNCRETINTTLPQCPFCATPIDRAAAELSAAATSRISQACSDASYLKIMAWNLITFFVLAFVPFVGLAGAVGTWFLRIAIPFMSVRWFVKYGAIKTPDPDFAAARRAAIIVAIVGTLELVSGIALQLRSR